VHISGKREKKAQVPWVAELIRCKGQKENEFFPWFLGRDNVKHEDGKNKPEKHFSRD